MPADSVDGSKNLGFGSLGMRAAPAEPSSRVQQEEASVGILNDIGRVKVLAGRGKKLGVFRGEGCSVRAQSNMAYLVGIEVTGKEGVLVIISQMCSPVAEHPGGGNLSPPDGCGDAVSGPG